MLEKSNVTTTTDGSVEVSPLRTHTAACRPGYAMFLLNWVVAHMTLINALGMLLWTCGPTVDAWLYESTGMSDEARDLLAFFVGLLAWLVTCLTLGRVQQMILGALPLNTRWWTLYLLISSIFGGLVFILVAITDIRSSWPGGVLPFFMAGLTIGALQASALTWNFPRVLSFGLATGGGFALGVVCWLLVLVRLEQHYYLSPGIAVNSYAIGAGVYASVTGLCLIAFASRAPTP